MASGDVVNTAARLQSAAPVNGILVDETTYRATSQKIDYREAEPVSAKGKQEPVPAWEVVEARSSYGVDLAQDQRAPLIGRERELDVLVNALGRVRAERSPQLVTLVGVPGIGKSRLVYELSQVIEDEAELTSWRQGRSLPYGEGVSFWALGEMVKAQAGMLETDSTEEAAGKLARSVRELVDESEADWVERHLGALVGLESEQELKGDHRAEAFAAWRRFFEATRRGAAARPRLRGPALGRRGPARLRRPPRRLGRRGSDSRGRHCSAGVALSPRGLGRREAERAHTLALSARRRRDRAPPGGPARAIGPSGRDPDRAPAAGGRKPALRRGVRPDGHRSRAPDGRRRAAAPRVGTGNRGGQARCAARRGEDAPSGRCGPRQGVLAGSRCGDRSRGSAGCRGGLAQARAEGVRASRAPAVGRGRKRVRLPAPARERRGLQPDPSCRDEPRSIGSPESGSSGSAGRRITPRCSRTITRARSSSPAQPAPTRAPSRSRRDARCMKPATAHSRWARMQRQGSSTRKRSKRGPRTNRRSPELLIRYSRVLNSVDLGSAPEFLTQAVEIALASGDSGQAAEAETLMCEMYWLMGRRDDAFEHLRAAEALVEDEPSSYAKAYVLANVSRFWMLAGDRRTCDPCRTPSARDGRRAWSRRAPGARAEQHRCQPTRHGRSRRPSKTSSEASRSADAINSVESARAYGNLASSLVESRRARAIGRAAARGTPSRGAIRTRRLASLAARRD